jgi:NTE family protein
MAFSARFLCIVLALLLCPLLQPSPGFGGGVAHAQETIVVTPQLGRPVTSKLGALPQQVLKRPKIGLVLTGGGARGAAQIGALKALERHAVPIDFIAATSMGSIIGGLYAAGWTAAEIESVALHTNWDEVLSLTEETNRADLFVDQKLAGERSFLTVRFEGLQPVLPSAVSTGQRFTTFLSTMTLQSVYHPTTSFDDLRIPFRAVTTDLVSGRRIVLGEGSLAEALRASATVPLVFNPIEKDSMRLVDGGLVDNIPVDVARDAGCDIVLVVNTTSSLRNSGELKAPWQTADQIMGIMMQQPNERSLREADLVITPELGRRLSSTFTGLDTLIAAGEETTEKQIGQILQLFERKKSLQAGWGGGDSGKLFLGASIDAVGGTVPDSVWRHIVGESRQRPVTLLDVQEHVNMLFASGIYRDVHADIMTDSRATRIRFVLTENPQLTDVTFAGCTLIPAPELRREFAGLLGHPLNVQAVSDALEKALKAYRSHGYSLARVDSTIFDRTNGWLTVVMNEGVISRVDVQGGIRTQDSFILNEFPLEAGEVFEIEKAERGVTNINASNLFEFVYLEVDSSPGGTVLTIRLRERPSQLVRFGLRADNERKMQGSLDIRDENFQGSGTELGLTILGGERNGDFALEYKAPRLFSSHLRFSVGAFYRTRDSYLYADAPPRRENWWDRDRVGEYSDSRYGASLSCGAQLERLGNATVELIVQDIRTKNLENAAFLEGRVRLTSIRLGTIVDTKDRYPFPSSGIGLTLSYEFAVQALGGEIAYNAFRASWESYATWSGWLTFHPKITAGFADKTMPFAQEFRLGGQNSFFGLHEDDRRGRQLLLFNLEFRYHLPFKILFDAYVSTRYDLGTISTVPEEIKINTFRHALGGGVAINTPIGPAIFSVGKSFYFSKDLPENPIQQGPLLFCFQIGYQL